MSGKPKAVNTSVVIPPSEDGKKKSKKNKELEVSS